MQHNPVTAYLQDCSFHERLMLASLVKCMKREGVEEIKWGEVSEKLRLVGFISHFFFKNFADPSPTFDIHERYTLGFRSQNKADDERTAHGT